MKNCSNNHHEIVYTARICPACKLLHIVENLNDFIDKLRDALAESINKTDV